MPSRASSDTNNVADCVVSASALASKLARIDAVVNAFDAAKPCGDPFVTSATSRSTVAATSSAESVATVTRPMSRASAGPNFSPVTKYRPAARADIFGSNVNEMIDGATPMRASVSAKVLDGPATTMSHAPISPRPPARTWPSTAPMTGIGEATKARRSSAISRARSVARSPGLRPAASPRSAPAQNVPPVWPSTTQRTSGSAAASASPSCNC